MAIEEKSVPPFISFPVAPRGTVWNGRGANRRFRKFAGAEDKPNKAYLRGFFFYDRTKPDNFTSYKLQFVDVIDGKLIAVPRALFEKVGLINGARRGLKIPQADIEIIKGYLRRYYKKMELPPPVFKKNICMSDLKRDFEKTLSDSGVFSNKASTYLASCLRQNQSDSDNTLKRVDIDKIYQSIINIKELLT